MLFFLTSSFYQRILENCIMNLHKNTGAMMQKNLLLSHYNLKYIQTENSYFEL